VAPAAAAGELPSGTAPPFALVMNLAALQTAIEPWVAMGGPEAVEAMAVQGLDLSDHRSSPVDLDLVQDADAIYAMTDSHRQAIVGLWPSAADKTHRLIADADLSDPIGAPLTAYIQTADQIREHLAKRIEEHAP